MAFRSVFSKNLFLGKVAVVTGGGTGIGRAIASELAHLGCKVVIASRSMDKLEKAAKEINQLTSNETQAVLPFQCNIRNEEEVQSLMQYTVQSHGRLDYLVNNGGGQFPSPVADIRAKGWHAVIETNLTGTFYCCKHAYHSWMKDKGGSIVNIIAVVAKGLPGMAHTGAARAGVENLMYSMAIEWANCGIRINSIAPGIIYSPTAALNYGDSPGAGFFKQYTQSIPAKRIGIPEEISGAVCFLLSPAASYITGVTMPIDGGLTFKGYPYPSPDHDNFPLPLEDASLKSRIQ